MKIVLTNFRCHENKTIELPEEGLICLSGSSGAGKSTLLSAIVYAFYGKIPGKVKKPYTHGKSSCKVELFYESLDLNIVRTSRPNRLVVTQNKIEYEDEVAQNIIDRLLNMTYDEFMIGAYIIQRSNSSILSISPQEQLKFIEIIALPQEEIGKFKENLKDFIKSSKENLLSLGGELKILEKMVSEKESSIFKPPTPREIVNGFNPEAARKNIESLESFMSKTRKNMEALQDQLEKIRKENKNYKEVEIKLQSSRSELETYKSQISDVPEENSADLEEEMNSLQNEIDSLEYYLEYLEKKKELEAAIKAHAIRKEKQIKDLGRIYSEEEIENLSAQLESLRRKKQEYDTKRIHNDQILEKKEEARANLAKIFKKIKSLNICTDIKKPSDMITALSAFTSFICPECNSNLFLDPISNSLVKTNEHNQKTDFPSVDQISFLQNCIIQIKSLSDDLNLRLEDLPDPPEDPDILYKTISNARRIRDRFQHISEEYPQIFSSLEAKLESFDVSSFEDWEGLDDPSLKLRDKKKGLSEITQKYHNLKAAEDQRANIHTKISSLEANIISFEKLLNRKKEGGAEELEKKIDKDLRSIMHADADIRDIQMCLGRVSKYEEYLEEMSELEYLKNKIIEIQQKIEEEEKNLESYLTLDRLSKEAEVLAMEETIKSINEHSRMYLDQMFEDPISVTLKSSRTLTKVQINTTIEYKGNTYSDIEELSGGERQRCDMAFLLAVSDMLGGKILMLDECLNNLDQNINTEVLSLIRDSTDKMILVVSHEAVEGLFSAIIPVEN